MKANKLGKYHLMIKMKDCNKEAEALKLLAEASASLGIALVLIRVNKNGTLSECDTYNLLDELDEKETEYLKDELHKSFVGYNIRDMESEVMEISQEIIEQKKKEKEHEEDMMYS